MKTLIGIGFLLLIVIVVFGSVYLDYWIFTTNHPGAPWWGWYLEK
ncbi:MAG: hypothetical protein WC329_02840 [Candidatus Omnitrophota bacterium]|jgi:hypothetical protein